MKIIMLAGKKKTGKTETFVELFDKLTNNGTKNIREAKKSLLPHGDKDDFECIVSRNAKWVALYSMGDFCDKVIEAIIKYAHLDTLVVACSTDNPEITDEFHQNGFHLYSVEKTSADNADRKKAVGEIIRLIDLP
jgi:hypothetical protein